MTAAPRNIQNGDAARGTPRDAERQGSPGFAMLTHHEVVDAITRSILADPSTCQLRGSHLPTRETVHELVELLRELAFPGFFTRRGITADNVSMHVSELVARAQLLAEQQIRAVLRYVLEIDTEQADCPDSAECDRRAREAAARFMSRVADVRSMLALDVQAAFEGDPAAHHPDETVFCYPGIDAIFTHRFAHELYKLGVPLLPRIMQEMGHSRTGIDIHPGATIGPSFFIDHGGGVVIGETTSIGSNARIYQGVTLGAKSFELDEAGRIIRTGTKRHPTIGDRVTIYAGAVILGGDTVIGDDCVVGGSVFVTSSIPSGHMVRQKQPELVLRSMDADHNGREMVGGG